MNIDSDCSPIRVSAPDTLVPSASKSVAFHVISTRRAKSSSLHTSADATMSSVAGIIIHPATISGTTLPHRSTEKREPIFIPKVAEQPKPISYIPSEIVQASMQHYETNNLFRFLCLKFGREQTMELMRRYHVGTSKHWQGATVFWQKDCKDRVRTGKIILYNPQTGKRVKQPFCHVTWVHSALHLTDFNLRQCFFGEHLLTSEKNKPVGLVESEKYVASICLISSG